MKAQAGQVGRATVPGRSGRDRSGAPQFGQKR